MNLMQKTLKLKATVNKPSKTAVPAWLPNAAVVAIGGMIYTTVAQWLMQMCAVWWEDGHLIDPEVKTSFILPMVFAVVYAFFLVRGRFALSDSSSNGANTGAILLWIIFGLALFSFFPIEVPICLTTMCLSSLGMVGLGILYFIYPVPMARTYASLSWLLGYLAIWVISSTFSAVSIWVFIAVWIVFGVFGGNTITSCLENASTDSRAAAGHAWRSTDTSAENVQRSRRARMTTATVSQYGRIPQDTFDLFNQHVRRVTGPIASTIPLSATEEMRNVTIKEVLTVTLRDWRENDNLAGLQAVDVDDLRSFVDASMAISGTGPDLVTLAIYKVTLRAMLLDWLDNWNVNEQSGPPVRRY